MSCSFGFPAMDGSVLNGMEILENWIYFVAFQRMELVLVGKIKNTILA